MQNSLMSAADLFDEFTSKMKPRTTDVKEEPRVGYGTFCGEDPTGVTNGNDDGSSGEFSWGCPDANGATNTPEGTDYDPDWPIEDPWNPNPT